MARAAQVAPPPHSHPRPRACLPGCSHAARACQASRARRALARNGAEQQHPGEAGKSANLHASTWSCRPLPKVVGAFTARSQCCKAQACNLLQQARAGNKVKELAGSPLHEPAGRLRACTNGANEIGHRTWPASERCTGPLVAAQAASLHLYLARASARAGPARRRNLTASKRLRTSGRLLGRRTFDSWEQRRPQLAASKPARTPVHFEIGRQNNLARPWSGPRLLDADWALAPLGIGPLKGAARAIIWCQPERAPSRLSQRALERRPSSPGNLGPRWAPVTLGRGCGRACNFVLAPACPARCSCNGRTRRCVPKANKSGGGGGGSSS